MDTIFSQRRAALAARPRLLFVPHPGARWRRDGTLAVQMPRNFGRNFAPPSPTRCLPGRGARASTAAGAAADWPPDLLRDPAALRRRADPVGDRYLQVLHGAGRGEGMDQRAPENSNGSWAPAGAPGFCCPFEAAYAARVARLPRRAEQPPAVPLRAPVHRERRWALLLLRLRLRLRRAHASWTPLTMAGVALGQRHARTRKQRAITIAVCICSAICSAVLAALAPACYRLWNVCTWPRGPKRAARRHLRGLASVAKACSSNLSGSADKPSPGASRAGRAACCATSWPKRDAVGVPPPLQQRGVTYRRPFVQQRAGPTPCGVRTPRRRWLAALDGLSAPGRMFFGVKLARLQRRQRDSVTRFFSFPAHLLGGGVLEHRDQRIRGRSIDVGDMQASLSTVEASTLARLVTRRRQAPRCESRDTTRGRGRRRCASLYRAGAAGHTLAAQAPDPHGRPSRKPAVESNRQWLPEPPTGATGRMRLRRHPGRRRDPRRRWPACLLDETYASTSQPAPSEPQLWRQAQLNQLHSLFKVTRHMPPGAFARHRT